MEALSRRSTEFASSSSSRAKPSMSSAKRRLVIVLPKKTRQTEEEVGRQHQGMARPGVRQVPEGSGEQGKMKTTGCKIISGAPMTLAVQGLMIMMMMMTFSQDRQISINSFICRQ